MVRFLHTSDLHLGKRFGNYPEDLRGRLREARHGVLGRLAEAARREGAATILLAGDSFDTETPTDAVLRQALAEMGQHGDINWIVLPGNHDSLQADQLWDGVRAAAPPNVTLALTNAPIALGAEAVVLPSPCTTRRPGRDLTEWMDGTASAEGQVRIGLAHGPIQTFSEDGVAGDVIAPDRARRAGLDYLALGDWHGQVAVNERTYYSGSPEPDRFKHERPGQALLVSLAGRGAVPEVRGLDVGQFSWRTLTLDLLDGEDGEALFRQHLPEAARRQVMLRIVLQGRTGLAARSRLVAAIQNVAPEFAHLELDDGGLAVQSAVDDLDRIDHAGALRAAADGLLAESQDPSRSEAERDIAAAALVRLFSYCEEVGA